MIKLFDKAGYIAWAARHALNADRHCPACGSQQVQLIKRKALVTALYCCKNCRLMFRVPKDDPATSREFYQRQYQQGFTTDCPDPATLQSLKSCRFRGSAQDYRSYIEVLQAAGVYAGSLIYDFGASWGYGSWQLMQAGYRVYAYEISAPRARYAAEQLGCRMLPQDDAWPEKVDCFFSAHVIEHLPNPRRLWQLAAGALKPAGTLVLFMPNGEPAREQIPGSNYHRAWGKVHPLLLHAEALHVMAQQHGFTGRAYSAPYQLTEIAARSGGALLGDELLYIAHYHGQP
jgi:2-polyprenyl-3-methyl-5-hydroxy-6-metoxy-1,4-benzoquinol methylase